ncbi:uncharacterized protein At4g22758-like [Bidens hawaiensis]|uniref:uncharacterized protein At4g22758-like n=1 Tax=Bidens hawaiensis TaxID=980011 RepID=UPI00404B0BF7
MTTKKNSPKKARLTEKWMPFNGRVAEDIAVEFTRPKLTKLLLKVTVQRSLVPMNVLISPESTVGDLIAAALRQYSKEGRRPVFPTINPPGFDLHYSQFCLERLSPDEKLNELGSRNFFLCPKQEAGSSGGIGIGYGGMTASSTCSEETREVDQFGLD